jgi:threonine synthase
MRYVSTRGQAPELGFEDVLLAGLASDGGLYVPAGWPSLPADAPGWAGLPYAAVAEKVIAPYVDDALGADVLGPMLAETYAAFDNPAVAPIEDLGGGLHLMELFHGPTLAFKDFALQLLGRLFDHVLEKRGERLTIVGATSGDTGSAAIAACRDRAHLDIFMLHPKGRVSDVQRRQMTTVDAPNVYNIALDGTFDDCQDIAKTLLGDPALRAEFGMSAVNSINWARVVAQVAYYVWAWLRLGAPDAISFAVPTGNFGNVYAGYCARQMGLPVRRLVVGSNRNDILTRFFDSADMEIRTVEPSLSPSMDIQVSSNFERLVFDLYGQDGAKVAAQMTAFRRDGRFTMDAGAFAAARALFQGARFSDEDTLATIGDLFRETGVMIDPHTAVGLAAARAHHLDPDVPMVVLATAHPAKFPDAVEEATGIRPALPPHLADLMALPEKATDMPNDAAAVEAFVRANATRAKPA